VPYREGKPLDTTIAPDRRRQHAIALVAVGLVAGIAIAELVRAAGPPAAAPLEPGPFPSAPPMTFTEEPPPLGGRLTADEVERVIATHRMALKRRCWDGAAPAARSRSTVHADFVVGARGDVVWIATRGEDALLNACVENALRAWTFPAHGERSATFSIPFEFRRAP